MELFEDKFWNIWEIFIRYGFWIIWGISLISKIVKLNLIKKNLGAGYRTYPDLSKVVRWRKVISGALLVLSAASLATALIKSASPYYFMPLLIMSGIVYFNGKLRTGSMEMYSVIFYSKNGFAVLPELFKLFSVSIHKWGDVEKVKSQTANNYPGLIIQLKSMPKEVKVTSHKREVYLYSNVFKEQGIEVV